VGTQNEKRMMMTERNTAESKRDCIFSISSTSQKTERWGSQSEEREADRQTE
jgi:hypothetical protein